MNEETSKFKTGNLGKSTRTPCASAASQTCPWLTSVSRLILPSPAKSTEYFPRNASDEFLKTMYPTIYQKKKNPQLFPSSFSPKKKKI